MKKADVDAFNKEASDGLGGEAPRNRRGKELELWHRWDQGGRKEEDLHPLLKSITPMIRGEANKRMVGLGGSIPRSAVENELQNAAMLAIKSYKPEKAQLSSHIHTSFQRITDFIAANRNAKHVPREVLDKKGPLQNVINELRDELGREPSYEEIHERTPNYKLKEIKTLTHGLGRELYTEMGTDLPGEDERIRPHDAFQLVKSKLTPQERAFGELHFPAEGTPPGIKNIARSLGVPVHKAYRLKANVESRVGKILKNE